MASLYYGRRPSLLDAQFCCHKMSFDGLPDEMIERIFSYVVADELQRKWGKYTPITVFEYGHNECGVVCSYLIPVFRTLSYDRRCRRILKGMCVFTQCPKHNKLKEYHFRPGLLHK